jgi:hypothetical protein
MMGVDPVNAHIREGAGRNQNSYPYAHGTQVNPEFGSSILNQAEEEDQARQQVQQQKDAAHRHNTGKRKDCTYV